MLRKVLHIVIGWAKKYKILEATSAEEKLRNLRVNICTECPVSKINSALKIIDGEAKNVSGLYCTRCKCPCDQKALVVQEKCPLNKW